MGDGGPRPTENATQPALAPQVTVEGEQRPGSVGVAYMAVRARESLYNHPCAFSAMYEVPPEGQSRGVVCAFADDTVTRFVALTYDRAGKLYVVAEDGEEHPLPNIPPMRLLGLVYLCVRYAPEGWTFVHTNGEAYAFFPPLRSLWEPTTFVLTPSLANLPAARRGPLGAARVLLSILHVYPQTRSDAQLFSIHDSRLDATLGQ